MIAESSNATFTHLPACLPSSPECCLQSLQPYLDASRIYSESQRQETLGEFKGSLVQSKFQDSHECYTEKPCLGGREGPAQRNLYIF